MSEEKPRRMQIGEMACTFCEGAKKPVKKQNFYLPLALSRAEYEILNDIPEGTFNKRQVKEVLDRFNYRALELYDEMMEE